MYKETTMASEYRLPGIIVPSDYDIHDSLQVTSLMLASQHGNIESILTLLKENQNCIMYRNVFDQTAEVLSGLVVSRFGI